MNNSALVKQIFGLAFTILMLAPGEASAKKAVCEKPVDNFARIGYPGNLPLSITEDEDEKECRFSVAGYPAGSPPEDQLRGALSLLRAADLGQASDAMIEAVTLLLAGASPFDDADQSLQDGFKEIANCLKLAGDVNPGQAESYFASSADFDSSDQLRCAVATPSELTSLSDFLGESARLLEADFPIVGFRNDRTGTLVEFLFLPILPRQ